MAGGQGFEPRIPWGQGEDRGGDLSGAGMIVTFLFQIASKFNLYNMLLGHRLIQLYGLRKPFVDLSKFHTLEIIFDLPFGFSINNIISLDLFSYYPPPAWPLPLGWTGISPKGPDLAPKKNCISIFFTRSLHRAGPLGTSEQRISVKPKVSHRQPLNADAQT